MYLHIVKTGGTSVEDYFKEMAGLAGFKHFHISDGGNEYDGIYDYRYDPQWYAMKEIADSTAAPKLAVSIANGPPGL
eukprot:6532726-Prymnesium_polylepis.1